MKTRATAATLKRKYLDIFGEFTDGATYYVSNDACPCEQNTLTRMMRESGLMCSNEAVEDDDKGAIWRMVSM